MAEMLTDLLQNIYSRISQLGKSIKDLQNSVDILNESLAVKVQTLVNSIQEMTENVKKEGETQTYFFENIGEQAVKEVKKLQEKIGLQDLEEVLEKLSSITQASEEALKPETVDILLHEVLEGIHELKSSSSSQEDEISDDELIKKVDESLMKQEKQSKSSKSETSEESDDKKLKRPPSHLRPPP